MLKQAERPAIVAGAWVDRKGAFHDTVILAEKLKAAVWEAPLASRTGFPQDHPFYQGNLAPAQKQVSEQLSGYDVVLVVGAPVFLYYPYVPGPVVEEGTKVLQITGDPDKAARAAVGTSLVGNVTRAVRHLIELLPEEVTIFEETGSVRETFHEHVWVNQPHGYFNAASGGLGYAMPASVGFKLARPERPTVCLIGDGSSMYSIQALWSAAQYGANVVFVVVDNSGYYILKGFREALGLGEDVPGLDVPDLNLVKVAEGLGVSAETVEAATTLPKALKRALEAERPYLLNVLVEPKIPELPSEAESAAAE